MLILYKGKTMQVYFSFFSQPYPLLEEQLNKQCKKKNENIGFLKKKIKRIFLK
jgi:hypothetical protein